MAIAGNPYGAPTFTVTFFTSFASSLLSSSVLLQPTTRDDVSKKDNISEINFFIYLPPNNIYSAETVKKTISP